MELDLRGQRAEAALEQFENYLDGAFRAGLPFVPIIHGKGTGALRAHSAKPSPPTRSSVVSSPPHLKKVGRGSR